MDYSQFFSADTPSFMRSPVREIFRRVDLNSIYSFAGGYPSADTFPTAELKSLSAKVLEKYGAMALQYGATQGVTELREALSRRYGVPLSRVQITTSSQQGIDICSRVLLDPGDVVLTSNPSYLGALQSFHSYRAEIAGVSRRQGGPEAFEAAYSEKLEALKAAGKKVKFLYMIPDFQNPSGETLTLPEREILLSLARDYDFLVLEDSPYRELRYEGEAIPTMYSLSPDRVLHLGSFSKIFAPGFRLGWIFGPEELLDKIYVCKQSLDLCPPIFDQYLAVEYLAGGYLDRKLEQTRAIYAGKRDFLLSLLERNMPSGVSWTHPEGGLFLFLTLPEGFDSVKFYDKALDAGVAYVAGSFFHADPSDGRNTMRLNFSFMDKERMAPGIALLGKLLKEELK